MQDDSAGRYHLFARRGSGSMAVEAALAECGAAFDLTEVPADPDTPAMAALLAANPRGQVPALVHPDGTVITETPAILTHLADSFPAARLIPRPGSSSRAYHDRWLAFLQVNVYEGILRESYPDRYTADPATAAAVRAAAVAYVGRNLEIYEDALTDGPYLLGAHFSVADIFAWMLCHWVDRDWLRTRCPRTFRLMETAGTRPALAAVEARHTPA